MCRKQAINEYARITHTQLEAVVIPGGGLGKSTEGKIQVPEWVQARLEEVLKTPSDFVITLSLGTSNKPPVMSDETGYPVPESVAAINYLKERKIDSGRILLPDTFSLDTIGNIFALRTQFVDPLNLRKLLIVTNAFQMPRTERICRWIFGLTPTTTDYDIQFKTVRDVGMDYDMRRERVLKERASFRDLTQKMEKIKTMKEFTRWLFTEHGAYSVKGWNSRKPVTGAVAKTY